MRHQNRYRHLLQHVRRRTPKDEFAYPGVAIGAHHQQVGSEVDGPHLESLTGGQACRWKSFRGRLDAMARESRRKLGTWDGACSLQCLLRVNPRNGDSFGLLQERNRIERCPGSLSCAVPTDEDTATKSFEARRIGTSRSGRPSPMTRRSTKSSSTPKLSPLSTWLAMMRSAAMPCSMTEFSHQRCLAMDQAPFECQTSPAHSGLKGLLHLVRVPLEKISISLENLR